MKIVVFALISLFLVSGCVQDQLPPIANNAACVNELESKNLEPDMDYVSGEILVGFKETIPESQAREIIESYGLEVKGILDFTSGTEYSITVHAGVEEGSEFIWICSLMENESVEYAELNGIMHLDEQSPISDLYLTYYYTAETLYNKIIISDSKITYTYFDSSEKCEGFMAQEPCWNESDLLTKETMLSGNEINELIGLLNKTNFMEMDNIYGGASELQRFYPYTITAKIDGVENEVVYQSFPGATPMPEGFKKIKDKMFELVVRNTFGMPDPLTKSEYELAKKDCEANGGQYWGCETLTGYACSMPTTDGGKLCSDSDDCEEECVAPPGCEIGETGVQGTCAERTYLVCGGVSSVENGICEPEMIS